MNNFNENPSNIQEFALRYLIKEHQEKNTSSWCSTNNEVVTVRSKPVLQYTFDGVVWYNVPTVVEQDSCSISFVEKE